VGATELRLQGTQLGQQGYHVNVGITRSLAGGVFTSLSYGYGQGSGVASLANPIFANTHAQSVSLNFGFHPYLGRPDSGAFPGFPGNQDSGTQIGP